MTIRKRTTQAIFALFIVTTATISATSVFAGPTLGVWYLHLDISKSSCAKRAKAAFATERLSTIWKSSANDAFTGDNSDVRAFIQCDKRGSDSKATIVVTGNKRSSYDYYFGTLITGMRTGVFE